MWSLGKPTLCVCAASALLVNAQMVRAQFPAVLDLRTGEAAGVSAVGGRDPMAFLGSRTAGGGDFNADGLMDFIVGAPGGTATPSGRPPYPPNVAYVVFGRPGLSLPNTLSFFDLDSTLAMTVRGRYWYDIMGAAVANLGDVNADALDDFIIGAPRASATGQCFVVFGSAHLEPGQSLHPDDFDGKAGFRIDGVGVNDWCGLTAAGLGDLNGDGFNDIAVGASFADPPARIAGGQAYIVFGGPNVGAAGSIHPSSLNGHTGFVVNGIKPGDMLGARVAGPGDVNDDGYDDLLLLAIEALPSGLYHDGQAYVLFGGREVGAGGVFELSDLDGTNGFTMDGLGHGEHGPLYRVGGVGDVNDDGVDDFAVAAGGECYVVFGRPGLGDAGCFDLATLDGQNGFLVPFPGATNATEPCSRVDLNGDGCDDLVIGHPIAPWGYPDERVYVFYGGRGLGASGSLDINGLDGRNGFMIVGPRFTLFGDAVAGVGDVNADGVEDLVIGSPRYTPSWRLENVGRFDLVFGRRLPQPHHTDAEPGTDVAPSGEEPTGGE